MPTAASQLTGSVFERSGVVLLARVTDIFGNNIQQANLQKAELFISNVSERKLIGCRTLTISSVVFDALQNDSTWTADETGYNLKVILDDTDIVIPESSNRDSEKFQALIRLTPTVASGNTSPITLAYNLTASKVNIQTI